MKLIHFVFIGLFIIGCASAPMQIPHQELVDITAAKSKIVVQSYNSRPLSITSVKSIAGAGLAAKLSKSDNLSHGEAIMTQYGIENASRQLAKKVVADLKANCAAIVSLSEETKAVPIPKAAPTYKINADYVLEIAVIGLEASYLPLNWQTYWIGMNAKARLIKKIDNRIVWEGNAFASGIRDKRMKLDVTEFEKDEAKKVKEIIDIGTTECSHVIVKGFLNKEKIKPGP